MTENEVEIGKIAAKNAVMKMNYDKRDYERTRAHLVASRNDDPGTVVGVMMECLRLKERLRNQAAIVKEVLEENRELRLRYMRRGVKQGQVA